MTYSDDITAPDQAIGSDDGDFESADLYTDDEYDVEYDDDDEQYDDDDEQYDDEDEQYDEDEEQDGSRGL